VVGQHKNRTCKPTACHTPNPYGHGLRHSRWSVVGSPYSVVRVRIRGFLGPTSGAHKSVNII